MKKLLIIILLVFCIGCQRGDFKFSIVHEGDTANHAGFFVNEEWWLEAGQPAPGDGYIVWVRGIEPDEE